MAAFAYANALTASIAGPLVPLTPSQTTLNGGVTSSVTLNFLAQAGGTIYVFLADSTGQAATITTDVCASSCGFSKLGSTVTGTPDMQVYATAVGAAAASSTITVAVVSNEDISVSVAELPGVTASVVGAGATGTSTTASISQTTTAANSMVISACGWFQGANTTLSSTAGTLLTNEASSTFVGLAMWGTFQATSGSATASTGTLSQSAQWTCQSIEAKGGGTTAIAPTLDIAQGYYYFSGGFSPQNPAGMTVKCEPGTWLNYTGTNHGMDLGVASQTAVTSGPRFRYVIDGCTWTGAGSSSEGIYINPYNTMISFRNNTFMNFGPPAGSGYMIYATGDNWDLEFGPQNQIFVNDYTPRNIMITNASHIDANSFTRVHDNVIACWPAFQNNGCTTAQTGSGFILDGDENRFYHNNIAFFLPAVEFMCNGANPPTAGCIGNQMDQNQVETPTAGTTTLPIAQFGGTQNGLLYTQNVTIDIDASNTGSILGPNGGSDKLLGARINFNSNFGLPAATPVVQLNNLTGQTGNTSYANECATSANNAAAQCPVIHTTGSNISPWINTVEGDVIGTLTKCAANGTSVAASAVACGSASAGLFSVPITTPTSAVVTTTALTATSTVFVRQRLDTVAGTALGVTCNTTTNATQPNISAMTATTFTIPLSAFSTNPGCYEYLILN